MRALFCRGYDCKTTLKRDLMDLFSKYGTIRSIDMKTGHALIYFEHDPDAKEAIRRLHNSMFGSSECRLCVEWSNAEPVRKNTKPTTKLFVANFDRLHTQYLDIKKHFEPHGKITNIRIPKYKNFAFVQYETQEEASKAFKETDKSTILDKVIHVEYALQDDNGSPKRGEQGKPQTRRSPNPRYRRDYSPEYVRRARNPGYDRRERAPYRRSRSPDNGRRYERSRSPRYGRY